MELKVLCLAYARLLCLARIILDGIERQLTPQLKEKAEEAPIILDGIERDEEREL